MIVCHDELLERSELPGSNLPVGLYRFGSDASGGYYVLVRFPAGWSRSGCWRLAVREEYLLIEGELDFTGNRTRTNDFVVIPAGSPRVDTMTAAGALALARFDGPPDWLDDGGPETASTVVNLMASSASKTGLGRGVLLCQSGQHRVWFVEEPDTEAICGAPGAVYSLNRRVFSFTPCEEASITGSAGLLVFHTG